MASTNIRIIAGVAAVAVSCLCVQAKIEPYGILPTVAHLPYQEREIMAIVHWGPNTFTNVEWGFGNVPAEKVNPDNLDPEQWVVAMKAAEIKSVVLVAKHHDGFCLWPSKLCPDGYSMANAGGRNKGFDVVRAVADACRKHGLKFGCYVSPWDRHQANYATPAYVDYFHNQWRELLTNYGEICEIWLDGANGGTGWYGGANGGKGERRSIPEGYYRKPQLLKMMHELQPMALAFGGHGNWSTTWCGTESGYSPETWKYVRKGEDGGMYWTPSESDTPFRQQWFFHPNQHPKSLATLVKAYYESVGRSAVLNFGIAPDTHGRVCDEDVKQLKAFGDWVRAFNAVDLAAGAEKTVTGGGLDQTIELKLPKVVRFNCCDLKEEITLGQRVVKFAVEAKVEGEWRHLASATTMGYRRIVRFDPVEADAVRVKVKGEAEPVVRSIALRFGKSVDTERGMADDALSRSLWKPLATSVPNLETVKSVFDGRANTLWHSHPMSGPLPPPQSFAIDCGKTVTIKGFDYLPRQDGCPRGLTDGYAFYTSDDGKNWTLRAEGEFGNVLANPVRQRVTLAQPVKARYFKFVGTHAANDCNHVAVAEFYLF